MKAETEAQADENVWAKLREPFPAEQVGKLPKPTKKDNQKGRCDECGKYHGLPAVHLDYVGHADVTGRLLDVDPHWTWEPMATNEYGLPLFTHDEQGQPTGLWIRLTVAGVTRLGYGSVDGGAHDAPKELIGDAIRNAAMRFGVALYLWRKENAENGEVTEAVDYGPCPLCKVGKVIRKTRRDGADFAACSTSTYDPKTKRAGGCSWKDWDPNFDEYQQRAATGATTESAPTAPTSEEKPPSAREAMTRAILHHIARIGPAARDFATLHGWKATDGAWSGWLATLPESQLEIMSRDAVESETEAS